jgi:hypothetical protein
MKLHENPELLYTLARAVEEETGIHTSFVEKDYWLTTMLYELSRSPYRDITVFKGGTSLSKAYGIIERFSEDVDIALIVEGLTGNQVKTRMDTISKSITRHVPEIHVEKVTSKGSRFRRTAHAYQAQAIMPAVTQVAPHLVLEFNTFANPYPFELREITSFVAELLQRQGRGDVLKQYELEPFSIQVLKPIRTLSEKVLALARASYAAEPVVQLQEKIRHTYDMYWLLKQAELRAFVESEEFFTTLRSVQVEDASNKEFQGAWAKQPLTAASIYQDDSELWKKLEPVYTSTFKSLVYGPFPSMSEIQKTFSYLSAILRKFDTLSVDMTT